MSLNIFTVEDLESCNRILSHFEPETPVIKVTEQIYNELSGRGKITKEIEELQKTLVGSYVKYDYGTGLGIYGYFKVEKITVNYEGNLNIQTSMEISVVDNIYSIDEASCVEVRIDNIKKLEKIDEDTYKSLFEEAIKHYKTLI